MHDNNDMATGTTNSQIREHLPAGTYTIEATTYAPGITGDFTLYVSTITVTVVPSPGDRDTLVALYNATDGENWTNNHNWLSNAPLAQWYGVTTDSGGRVTVLGLRYNQLSGEIPPELGNLSNLTNLDLDLNQLSGEIPAQLSNLSNLMYLNLGSNQLRGEIPPELGNLSDLEWLTIDLNQLSGEIPAQLSNLSNLMYLNLSSNQLSGEIPAELGNLSNLWRLSLGVNQLSGEIPAQLGNLSNLTSLGLNLNQLSGEIPAELGNLSSLERLFFTSNQLSGVIPEELGNLSKLKQLYLRYNRLSGEIPEELGRLSNLEGLYLQGNRLSGEIPTELGRLSNLTHLVLDNNQLSGMIPVELVNLSELRWLHLASNQLTGCIPQGLQDIANNDFAALGLPFCGDGSPDLIVNRASVSESNPDAGSFFTLYAQVHNQGGGASAATTLRYYRSGDDTISTRDTEIGRNDIVPLGASETWPPPSIGLNAPTLPGTYYYGACVDPVPGESDTRNNCSAADTVTVGDSGSPPVPPVPPVVESASVSDSSLEPGQLFTFYATVRNPGSVRSAATTLRYYRSGNPSISSSDTEVGTDQVGGLPANGTSFQSIVLTAPSVGGTYYHGACVDSVPGFPDANDSCTSGVRVTVSTVSEVSPDLVVESVSVSDSSLEAGQSFTFYATVRNRGDGRAASTTLRHLRSINPSISNDLDTPEGTDPVGSLPANRTSHESIELTAPTRGGTYYYGACVDPVPGESDPNNNCSSGMRVTVTEVSPDLVVVSPSVSDSSLDAGQSFLLRATVRNRGSGRSALTTLRYFLSVNSSISDGGIDTEVGSNRVPGIPASGTSVQPLVVTAPSVGGTYYYGACVDSVPGESDPNNNCSSGVRVTVTEVSPDLVVISPSLRDERGLAAPLTSDISVDPGASFTLYATAHNRGDGPSNSAILSYYRSGNDTISTSDTVVGTDSVDGLPANGVNNEWIDLYAPSSSGTYYYGACVDSVSGESNTRNNCSSAVKVTVPPVRVTDSECTHTSNLFGRTYTLTGTVVASRSLNNVTITGYIVRYANEREVDRDRVGEYDFGSMSANQPEDFEMSSFFLFNILERRGCDFEFEWD